MRKHQKRWVALLGAAAISTGGLGALPGTASADDKEPRSLSWPVVKQGETSYNIDGYAIGYLPPGLSEYSVNATSSTDHRGNNESQVSWVQGPDQLYGRVAVVRSERLQELDDLRDIRYSHLSESSLEHLEDNEAFEHGAYLSEETGDLFWLDQPGVAVTTHLQPERWDSDELAQLAESVTEEKQAENDAPAEPVGTEEEEQAEAEEPQKAEEVEEEPVQEEAEDSAEEEGAQVEEQQPEEEGSEDPEEESDAPEPPADEAEEGAEDTVPADEGAGDTEEQDDAQDAEGTEEQEETGSEGTEEQEDGSNPADGGVEDTEGVEEETDQDGAEGTEGQEETAPEDAEDAEDAEEPAEADVLPPAEADLPEGVSTRAVQDCLIGQFVDLDNGEEGADLDGLSPENDEFIEQALAEGELSGSDRDRLLATVWYHGDENDKTAATDQCAQRFGLERSEVEDVIAEVSDLIAAMEDEADQADTTEGTDEQPSQGTEDTEDTDGTEDTGGMDAPEDAAPEGGALDDLAVDPVGAGEWEELWAPLSWSVPAEES